MQVQSKSPDQEKRIQALGMAAFIGAGVLFALGFVLMLTTDGVLMSRQLPLMLMTVAAIDVCFAAALSALDVPAVEKTRLRTLSIVGAIVVVIAATLIASNFSVGAFEIVVMLVGLGGAPGMYKLGEIVGSKLKTAETTAAKPAATEPAASAETPKPPKPPKPSESAEAPKGGESSSTA